MGRRDLLSKKVPPAARAYRARWLLALDEAARLERPATWKEWNRIWFGSRPYTRESARRAFLRLRAELRALGIRLEGRLHRSVHAHAPEVRMFVAEWRRRALEIEERRRARLEGRPAEVAGHEPSARDIARDAVFRAESKQRMTTLSYAALREKHGIGYGRLRYLLEVKKLRRPSSRRARIEETRTPEALARALELFDSGASVRAVAKALGGCSSRTAWAFLKRQGRDPSR